MGNFFFPAQLPDEVLITAHVCHPSLANDNLSGIAVATALAMQAVATAAAAGLPVSVHSSNNRRDHVAREQRGTSRPEFGTGLS